MAELISVEKVKGIWGKKKKGKLLSFWVFFILSAFIKEKVEKGNMEMDPFENKDCERVASETKGTQIHRMKKKHEWMRALVKNTGVWK